MGSRVPTYCDEASDADHPAGGGIRFSGGVYNRWLTPFRTAESEAATPAGHFGVCPRGTPKSSCPPRGLDGHTNVFTFTLTTPAFPGSLNVKSHRYWRYRLSCSMKGSRIVPGPCWIAPMAGAGVLNSGIGIPGAASTRAGGSHW